LDRKAIMAELTALFLTISTQLNLPPGLLEAVCYVESEHNPAVIAYSDGLSNSFGLCQIKYTTARWMGFNGTEEDLLEPYVNAFFAGKYLAYQLKKYNNIVKALIAYNRGNAKNLNRTEYSDKVLKVWGKDVRRN
jgi:soluble lytic murein transglycosylase-like protein